MTVHKDKHGELTDVNTALDYILGGKGKFTLKSTRTGNHYTYQLSTGDENSGNIFVRRIKGQDQIYLGYIRNGELRAGLKGKVNAKAYTALHFALKAFFAGVFPKHLEVWHEGTCGKCGRTLTNPDSIASGIGPVCAANS